MKINDEIFNAFIRGMQFGLIVSSKTSERVKTESLESAMKFLEKTGHPATDGTVTVPISETVFNNKNIKKEDYLNVPKFE